MEPIPQWYVASHWSGVGIIVFPVENMDGAIDKITKNYRKGWCQTLQHTAIKLRMECVVKMARRLDIGLERSVETKKDLEESPLSP